MNGLWLERRTPRAAPRGASASPWLAARGSRVQRTEAVGDLRVPWSDRIDSATGPVRNALGWSALPVRPDGIVAWATDGLGVAGELEAVAKRWFGAATGATS